MVIKINKKGKKLYKSSKIITTSSEVKGADRFDSILSKRIKKIEKILIKEKLVSKDKIKKDPLRAWYIIGKNINSFLKSNKLNKEDEILFWEYLYGRSNLINKGLPSSKVSTTRNDFITSSILASFPFKTIENVGPWSLWREVIGYRLILKDKRVLNWVIEQLETKPRTRNEARPFLKAVSMRLKRIDTSILNDKEISELLQNLDNTFW